VVIDFEITRDEAGLYVGQVVLLLTVAREVFRNDIGMGDVFMAVTSITIGSALVGKVVAEKSTPAGPLMIATGFASPECVMMRQSQFDPTGSWELRGMLTVSRVSTTTEGLQSSPGM